MKPIKNLIILLTILILLLVIYLKINLEPKIIVPEIEVTTDRDGDGIPDNLDIVEGARKEVKNKTIYKSGYYSGGFPPKNEGVCTDVVWRALKNAGYDLKSMIDEDIKNNIGNYKRVDGKPDPNIDFRRVPNLQTYLEKNAISLTIEIIPGNVENLKQWQAGDIVIFDKPNQHIAIISDKRDKNGINYIIHNYSDFPKEDNWVFYGDKKLFPIIGHYRLKY